MSSVEEISEWLASGFTDEQIIATLVGDELSTEEATAALKEVYVGWQTTSTNLDLQDINLVGWHVFMRKKILQTALTENTATSLRLALSILDSIANLQGLSTVPPQIIPLSITFEPKPEDEPEDKKEPEENEQ